MLIKEYQRCYHISSSKSGGQSEKIIGGIGLPLRCDHVEMSKLCLDTNMWSSKLSFVDYKLLRYLQKGLPHPQLLPVITTRYDRNDIAPYNYMAMWESGALELKVLENIRSLLGVLGFRNPIVLKASDEDLVSELGDYLGIDIHGDDAALIIYKGGLEFWSNKREDLSTLLGVKYAEIIDRSVSAKLKQVVLSE